MGIVAVIIGGLAAAVGVVVAQRYWVRVHRGGGGLTDGDIAQIEQDGWVDVDEPLDLDEIREEEERFWEESWDEPEEW